MSVAASPELIDSAQMGDAEAIAELLRTYQPDIKRFARRTCATSEDAEDAVQFALWQLYRRVGALRTISRVTAWLFRVVERECRRLLRRHAQTLPIEEVDEVLLPHSDAVPVDLQTDLARVIAGLSKPYRDVLVLRDVHELTAPEVAFELKISIEAVKSRLHRARATVRERLRKTGYLEHDLT